MTDVNPYVNNFGWPLTIYTQNGGSWTQTSLTTASSVVHPTDGRARNIWDSPTKAVRTVGNIFFNGMPGSRAWILPNPNTAQDIDSVNVIVTNNSNATHTVPGGHAIQPGETRSFLLPLGVIAFTRLLTGKSGYSHSTTTATTISHSHHNSSMTNPIQILPLPDQVSTISSDGTLSVASQTGSTIPKTTISIHNCYTITLRIRIRPSLNSPAQNLGQIQPNQTIRLGVYTGYQVFLESDNQRTMSGVFTVPSGSSSETIFFQTTGSVSTSGCTGTPTPPGPGPSPSPGTQHQVKWDTADFLANGTGLCRTIRVGDTVHFISSDGQSHSLIQTNSSWQPVSNPMWNFPASTSFNRSITFTSAGCFYLISQPQASRMRLRVSVTNTDGSGGCSSPCPSQPFQPVTPVTPVQPVTPTNDQSWWERWWWAVLIGAIIIIIIIILIIWAAWPRGPDTKTTTVTSPKTRTASTNVSAQPPASVTTVGQAAPVNVRGNANPVVQYASPSNGGQIYSSSTPPSTVV